MKIAIVPARGGSKRIPRKNLREFAGRPMIAYAIAAARDTGKFDRIVVSTDDPEIADVARAEGAEVPFLRPAELADDYTPTVPVIAHALRAGSAELARNDVVACIYPTVPLLAASCLLEALCVAKKGGGEYVFPVVAFPSAIQRALRRDTAGTTTPFNPECGNMRTQDLEPAWYDAGQFYVAPAGCWLDGAPIHGRARTIVVPWYRAVDIDTPEDWERAEVLYQTLRGRPDL